VTSNNAYIQYKYYIRHADLCVYYSILTQCYRILAQRNEEISKELLSLRVIHHLLYAMGNQEHADAQRQASLALEVQLKHPPSLTHSLTHYVHSASGISKCSIGEKIYINV